MAVDLVPEKVASEWARDLRLAHPADNPPKTKDVPCTSLRVGEMHGRRKDGGRHVQKMGDDGLPMIIRMAIYSCPVRESNCRS
ncbi:hypothetical protein NQZ68_012513 [Dissostichus eleginoides]|nr:hypothetical protein NQZ68_012513 [Dissostichus eleginoides]